MARGCNSTPSRSASSHRRQVQEQPALHAGRPYQFQAGASWLLRKAPRPFNSLRRIQTSNLALQVVAYDAGGGIVEACDGVDARVLYLQLLVVPETSAWSRPTMIDATRPCSVMTDSRLRTCVRGLFVSVHETCRDKSAMTGSSWSFHFFFGKACVSHVADCRRQRCVC